ncbi:MAG: response regulator [Planctomycetaceae bacterium]|nr:response regulator [Planctomycetaceae bacterium]
MQVLLADESRAVRAMTRAALQQSRFAGDSLRDAEAGDQLLSWIHMRPAGPALVVVDWDLPGMNGLQLMDTLEELRQLDEVGVLFCVNRSQAALAETAVQRGARGFIVRPFSDDELRAKLESIAETRRAAPSDVLRDIVTSVRARAELPGLLSLPSAVISELFAVSTRVRTLAGETIVWPGQQVNGLSFITAGEVDVQPASGSAYVRATGECFAERAFVCGEPARVTVRARTAVDVVQVPKERMVELARRHAAVRAFLTALLEPPAREAASDSELSGTLESLPFADLIQFLNTARKTGHLLLLDRGVQGIVSFKDGEAQDAAFAGQRGEAAFLEMATWTRARFEFRAGEPSGQRTLARSTMKLLMDAFAQSAALAG